MRSIKECHPMASPLRNALCLYSLMDCQDASPLANSNGFTVCHAQLLPFRSTLPLLWPSSEYIPLVNISQWYGKTPDKKHSYQHGIGDVHGARNSRGTSSRGITSPGPRDLKPTCKPKKRSRALRNHEECRIERASIIGFIEQSKQ